MVKDDKTFNGTITLGTIARMYEMWLHMVAYPIAYPASNASDKYVEVYHDSMMLVYCGDGRPYSVIYYFNDTSDRVVLKRIGGYLTIRYVERSNDESK